jgi:hypothetical protein
MRRDPDRSLPSNIQQLTRSWGDETWRDVGYPTDHDLLGPRTEKVSNEEFAEAFQQQLNPRPDSPMRRRRCG